MKWKTLPFPIEFFTFSTPTRLACLLAYLPACLLLHPPCVVCLCDVQAQIRHHSGHFRTISRVFYAKCITRHPDRTETKRTEHGFTRVFSIFLTENREKALHLHGTCSRHRCPCRAARSSADSCRPGCPVHSRHSRAASSSIGANSRSTLC